MFAGFIAVALFSGALLSAGFTTGKANPHAGSLFETNPHIKHVDTKGSYID